MHLEFPFLALSLGRRTSISGCQAFLGTVQQASASISSSEMDLLWVFIFLLYSCLHSNIFLLLPFMPPYSNLSV